jgi:osmotically-inducible protein OsmY
MMTTATITGSDVQVRDAVVRQLDWDPQVDASDIGVAARDGVVTLTGFVDSYAGKLAAERVAKRVRGVRAVANEVTVRLIAGRTDADIAHDAVQVLKLWPTFADTVQVAVHHGHVTLTGTVEWLYQKQDAELAVRHSRGMLGVYNHIIVRPRAMERDVQRRIVRALHHNADVDARQITVDLHDSTVTLRGTVGSWMQREAAERAAGNAPGIERVDNQVEVEPRELSDLDELC